MTFGLLVYFSNLIYNNWTPQVAATTSPPPPPIARYHTDAAPEDQKQDAEALLGTQIDGGEQQSRHRRNHSDVPD